MVSATSSANISCTGLPASSDHLGTGKGDVFKKIYCTLHKGSALLTVTLVRLQAGWGFDWYKYSVIWRDFLETPLLIQYLSLCGCAMILQPTWFQAAVWEKTYPCEPSLWVVVGRHTSCGPNSGDLEPERAARLFLTNFWMHADPASTLCCLVAEKKPLRNEGPAPKV